MPEHNRWNEDRGSGAWSRDDQRYGRNDENESRYRAERSGGARYGSGDYGRPQGGGDRAAGYGLDRYGVPSDYNFGGPEVDSYGREGGRDDYGYGWGEGGYGQGQRGAYGQRQGGDYGRSSGFGERDRDYGADRYQLGDGRRAQEDRSWWSQTRDEVSSWFGDNDAARRRQQDELRAGEHRGRGPKGYTRSDERIREDVNDRLTDHPFVDASEIEVSVSGAEVTLNGTVSERADKRRAEDVAERVSGVKHVQNNLRVKDSGVSAKSGQYGGATVGSTANQTSATGQTKTN